MGNTTKEDNHGFSNQFPISHQERLKKDDQQIDVQKVVDPRCPSIQYCRKKINNCVWETLRRKITMDFPISFPSAIKKD
ncbi:hypothetical protein C0J52_17051 [Blattella germanica]|nr:hypothetical protein C0J52_17051 [Blattella germanica]